MNSIAIAKNVINVPFNGDELLLIDYDNEPYVAMRPFVESMGMDWASQFTKLKQRFKSTVAIITTVGNDGKSREMVCLALRKLTGWLHTININKVRPEIKDKVSAYQDRSDDVLYEYWTTGEVKPKSRSTTDDRAPLRNAVDCLMTKKRLSFPKAYKYVHAKYGVNSIDEVPMELLPDAVDYIYSVALEGDYMPKDNPREIANIRAHNDIDAHNVNALAKHFEAIYTAWKVELYPSLSCVDSPIASRLYDRFKDGYSFLRQLQESLNEKHPALIK